MNKKLLAFCQKNPPKAKDYTMIAGGKVVAALQDNIRRNFGMPDDLVKALRDAEGIPAGLYQFNSMDIMKIRK